jgi:hypothetical protein
MSTHTSIEHSHLKFIPAFLILAALLLIAAACSPASNSPAAASRIPTTASSVPVIAANCTVLSKDEVSTIMAEPVVEVRDPAKDGSLCVYQTQNLILEFNTQKIFGGFGDSVNFMKQTRANFIESGDTPLDVPGLGDEAYYHGGSGYVRVLQVRKGAVVYTFGIRNITTDNSLSSPDNADAMELTLAQLLLTRVP